jgi:hypothetical protein
MTAFAYGRRRIPVHAYEPDPSITWDGCAVCGFPPDAAIHLPPNDGTGT